MCLSTGVVCLVDPIAGHPLVWGSWDCYVTVSSRVVDWRGGVIWIEAIFVGSSISFTKWQASIALSRGESVAA